MTYEEALLNCISADERYVVMTAENRGPIRNMQQRLGERFVDAGIAEQALIGAACGLALRGRIPIVHCLACFLTMRAFEFIRTDVGISGLPVKLIGTVAGFLSEANGPTHQAVEDVSLMRGVPPISIVCPADIDDMLRMLPVVLRSPGPVYLRYNPLDTIVDHAPFSFGSAEQFSNGDDLAIITYGILFAQAMKAAEMLENKGVSVRVINCRSLKPLDEAALLQAATECSLLVTLEDHFLSGGLFSIVAELFARTQATASLLPISLENRWFKPLMMENLLEYESFSAQALVHRIQTHMAEFA